MRFLWKAKFYVLMAVISLGFTICGDLHAQIDTGTLRGTVRDESGQGENGAKVILKNEATGFLRTTFTHEDGSYVFTPLPVGSYTVSVEAEGFATVARTEVPVSMQQLVTVDFSLRGAKAGEPSVARSPVVEGFPGQLVTSPQLDALPMRIRNYALLTDLMAGTSSLPASYGGLAATGGFTADGNPVAQNNYRIDGIDNNNHFPSFLPKSSSMVMPPNEGIQEFSVHSGYYSAILGGSSGAVVNVVTKSGSNQLHGSGWEYFGNDRLGAADFFDNASGLKKATSTRNQFGASVGGPVVLGNFYDGRNKTFFFADYQGMKARQGVPMVETVPTAAERNSNFTDFSDLIAGQSNCTVGADLLGRSVNCGTVFDPATTRLVTTGEIDPVTGLTSTGTGYVRDPFVNNQIPSNRIDPVASALLNLYPSPTMAGIYNNYATNAYRREDANSFDLRIDHSLSDRDQAFGRLSYYQDPQLQEGPFPGTADGGGFTQVTDAKNIAIGETHTISAITLNDFRVGFNGSRATMVQAYANNLGDIPAQFGILGITQESLNGGMPTLNIGWLSALGSRSFLPISGNASNLQVTDVVTRIYAKHTVKIGGEAMRLKESTLQGPYSRGEFNFGGNYTSIPNMTDASTGIAQILLQPINTTIPYGVNHVGGPNQVLASSISNIDNRRLYGAAFVQDDWRYSSKISVNASLRWEYFQPPLERYEAEANFYPGNPGAASSGASYMIPSARSAANLSTDFTNKLTNDGIALTYTGRSSLLQTTRYNIAPRVGVAYQFSNKIVFRGGIGYYYGGLQNTSTLANLGGNYPFQVNYIFNAPSNASPIIYPSTNSFATLEEGLSATTLNPGGVYANGLALSGVQKNIKPPYTEAANLGVEYRLNNTDIIRAYYVGSYGKQLYANIGTNEVSQIVSPFQQELQYAPFHDFAYGSPYLTGGAVSKFHSAQLEFQRTFYSGLNLLVNFTFGKTRTDALPLVDNSATLGYRAPYIEAFGIKSDMALADFNVGKALHVSGGYELPFGKGKRYFTKGDGILGRTLSDWNLNWILTWETGQPVTIPCTIMTASGIGCNALMVGGAQVGGQTSRANQYWNAAAFVNPAVAGSTGQADFTPLGGAPSQVTGPGISRLDLSLHRSVRITEKIKADFRVDALNVANHPDFANPSNLNFTNPLYFGLITSTRDNPNDARLIQLGFRVNF